MISENLLANRKPQSDSIALSVASERLEQFSPDRLGDPRSVVRNANLNAVFALRESHLDFSGFGRHDFTGIKQHIGENTFYFFVVEPGLASSLATDGDTHTLKFWTCAHRVDGPFDGILYGAKNAP